MDYFDLATQLVDLSGTSKSLFIKSDPEILDFTSKSSGKLEIWNDARKLELDVTPSSALHIGKLLESTVFDKDYVERVYAWNLKPFFSYIRYFGSKHIIPTNLFLDLKPLEYFLNIRRKAPGNFIDAVNRVKSLIAQKKDWQSAQKIFKAIHSKLIFRVLPDLESTPLINETHRCAEHPCYEIEGQVNGRLNCSKAFSNSYLPHVLGPEARKSLKPRGLDLRFVTSDFRHCEVNVLQWLSGDEVLHDIIESGEDVHKKIYEIVTGDVCNSDKKRNMSKSLFLPVMYGCTPKGISLNLSVSESVGRELYRRIEQKFSTACAWMKEMQSQAKHGVYDYFGRPRKFKEEESHLARNFLVQAVAATVCQEKMINLHDQLDGETAKLVFSVHDGFGMVTQVKSACDTYRIIKDSLESESMLCPGLKMKTEIRFGARLDSMKSFVLR